MALPTADTVTVFATTASAVAASISALAALIALIAVRNTNKIARAHILPLLSFANVNGSLKVENAGNGPALNLRFVPLTIHFTDMDWMFEYTTRPASISPGKSETIQVLTRNIRNLKAEASAGSGYDILTFAKNVNNIDALFEDSTNHTHAIRLVFGEADSKWFLRTQKYFAYGNKDRLVTWLKIRLFRSRLIARYRLKHQKALAKDNAQ